MDTFCGSKFWNYTLSWNSDLPDLTICFQDTVLTWTPCAFLLIFIGFGFACLHRDAGIIRKNTNIPWDVISGARILFSLLLVIVSVIEIIHAIVRQNGGGYIFSPVHYVTPIIKLVTFCLVTVFMYKRRQADTSSSVVLFLFWLIYGLISVFSLYSVVKNLIRPDDQPNFPKHLLDIVLRFATATMIVSEMILTFSSKDNVIQSMEKIDDSSKLVPEISASIPSLLTFWWVNPMIILGYKRPLKIDDLYDLRYENQTINCFNQLTKYWDPLDKEHKRFILWPMFRAFAPHILMTSSLKLISCFLTFANPVVLNLLLFWLDSKDSRLWQGIMYAFLMFTISLVDSIILNTYEYNLWISALRMKAAVTDAIYQKAFRLSPTCRSKYTTGQIVNFMAVDAQKIFEFMMFWNYVWASPLQITIASCLLWQQLGIATLSGVAVMLTLIPLNAYVTKYSRRCQVNIMKEKDKRAKMLNEVFAGIKVLKLYAWEPSFIQKIRGIRNVEMSYLREQILYVTIITFTISCSPIAVSVITFLTYTYSSPDHNLDASKAFVSLALLNLLRLPLGFIPILVNIGTMFWVSMRRISDYINDNETDLKAVSRETSAGGPAIQVKDASFSWEPDTAVPSLEKISINVKKGELVAIVGRVGTGKSSLMSALLCDMYKSEGTVNMDGTIAYVPQQAWIQNATVRENIVFTSPHDENKYNRVLDACALTTDLTILPAGDATEIGEKGINLSGGQKQRVSLARAVYSDNDIFLMDDPLSAVDTHVGKHIFEQVIGPKGMLKHKTRILVTQKITLLPHVDNIIVMVDGKISESGSYPELMQKGGAFADFIQEFLASDGEAADEDEDLKQIRPEIERQLSQISSSRSQSIGTYDSSIENQTLSRRFTNSSVKSVDKRAEDPKSQSRPREDGKLVDVEEERTGGVTWQIYKSYFSALGWWSCFFTLFFSVVYSIFNVFSSIWLSEWADDNRDEVKRNDTGLRDLRMGGYAGLGLGEALFTLASNLFTFFGVLTASSMIHDAMLSRIMRAPMSFFDTTPNGRMLNRFTKDIDALDTTIRMNIRSLLNTVFKTLVTIAILLMQTPWFLAAAIPLTVIYIFVQRVYIASSRQLKRIESTSKSPIYTHFSETVTGSTSIRAFNAVQHFTQELERRVDRNGTSFVMSAAAARWLAVRLEFMGNVIILFSSLVAVTKLGGQSAAEAGLTISYALAVTQNLNWLIRSSVDLENSLVSAERCIEYMSVPSESDWYIEATKPPDSWPESGKVEFDRYSTKYREGLELVLRDATFQSHEHEKIGIVGRTGAGKSSLTLSLFRLIEAVSGKIVIDDVDISKLGLLDLRSRLTIIPQDPVLFSGSLRMNLDPFDAHTDERIWEALRLAHLQEFAATLTSGLLHEVTEGGDNLSVGQRQLVCLARALLRKSKILVLDEATAAVDVETDELIQKTIRDEFADCTIITIAHRLNTVIDYDRILVLDAGKVVEFDSPHKLMLDSNSIFYSMAKVAGLLPTTMINNESD